MQKCVNFTGNHSAFSFENIQNSSIASVVVCGWTTDKQRCLLCMSLYVEAAEKK
jgi:hypothetical protein